MTSYRQRIYGCRGVTVIVVDRRSYHGSLADTTTDNQWSVECKWSKEDKNFFSEFAVQNVHRSQRVALSLQLLPHLGLTSQSEPFEGCLRRSWMNSLLPHDFETTTFIERHVLDDIGVQYDIDAISLGLPPGLL